MIYYPPTSWLILSTVVGWILYDIWVVWRRGAEASESWQILTWWLLHPLGLAPALMLIGHLFFPVCGPARPQGALTLSGGTLIGISVIVVMLVLCAIEWKRQALELAQERMRAITHRYVVGMAAWGALSIVVGHLLFPQHVTCAP